MMGSEYDVGALRKAAKTFDDLSRVLYQVNGRPGDDPYHIPEISWGYFEHAQECRQAYSDVRDRMHALMEGGGDTLSYVANSLRRAADGRERTEEAAADLLRKVGANLGTAANPSSAEVTAVLEAGISGLGKGIVAAGDGVADSVDYLSDLVTGQVENSGPVPDPEAGRQTYYEAMEWAKPLIELGESIRSHLDQTTRRFLGAFQEITEWGERYVEIGHAANEWASAAERVTRLGLAAGRAAADVRRSWRGPAAEEFDTYVTYELLPLYPVVARRFRDISATLATVHDAAVDFWESISDAAKRATMAAIAGGIGAFITGPVGAAALAAAIGVVAALAIDLMLAMEDVLEAAEESLGSFSKFEMSELLGGEAEWPEPETDLEADGWRSR